jgi:hypothetical protein
VPGQIQSDGSVCVDLGRAAAFRRTARRADPLLEEDEEDEIMSLLSDYRMGRLYEKMHTYRTLSPNAPLDVQILVAVGILIGMNKPPINFADSERVRLHVEAFNYLERAKEELANENAK